MMFFPFEGVIWRLHIERCPRYVGPPLVSITIVRKSEKRKSFFLSEYRRQFSPPGYFCFCCVNIIIHILICLYSYSITITLVITSDVCHRR